MISIASSRSAIIAGPDDCYRYELRRVWDPELPPLVVCMLNPSTADHQVDDPTVLALIHFATAWGYGGLIIVNLFALRTSKPANLIKRDDRFGPENARYLNAAMSFAAHQQPARILAAWGNGGELDGRNGWFCSLAAHVHRVDLVCLGATKFWQPKHPMARGVHRIPRDQKPMEYQPAVRMEAA